MSPFFWRRQPRASGIFIKAREKKSDASPPPAAFFSVRGSEYTDAVDGPGQRDERATRPGERMLF